MRLLHAPRPQGDSAQRGAALLLSFLVLIVILMICYQVNRTTSSNRIESHRNETLSSMELGIDSILLQVFEDLKADAEGGGGAGEEGAPSVPTDGGLDGGEGGEGGESNTPVDSKMDEWASPDTVHINEQALRVLIVDEDSKFNILGILSQDEDEAEEAMEILKRVLENAREGTEHDIDSSKANEMANAILTHLKERDDSILPKEARLSDPDDERDGRARMPSSLREFVVLEPFEEHHFRDFFDSEGNRVHSLEWFLTVYTTVTSQAGQGSGGGYAVNVNTAPLAVLNALFDPREVDTRVWDDVIDYRNQEEEATNEDDEDVEPQLDEFGNEIVPKKFFDNLDELEELRNYSALEPEDKAVILRRLTTTSQVFSIYVVARQSTRAEENQILEFESAREREQYERDGTHLIKVVRCVVWRQSSTESASIVPLVRWDVLEQAPLEVLDIPED